MEGISLSVLAVVGFFTSVSIIALSLIAAASLRTIFDLMTIGCFLFSQFLMIG